MLRITVELVPHGDESQKSTLSQFEVVNKGYYGEGVYNYHVRKSADQPEKLAGFYHKREDGLFQCVKTALGAAQRYGLDKI